MSETTEAAWDVSDLHEHGLYRVDTWGNNAFQEGSNRGTIGGREEEEEEEEEQGGGGGGGGVTAFGLGIHDDVQSGSSMGRQQEWGARGGEAAGRRPRPMLQVRTDGLGIESPQPGSARKTVFSRKRGQKLRTSRPGTSRRNAMHMKGYDVFGHAVWVESSGRSSSPRARPGALHASARGSKIRSKDGAATSRSGRPGRIRSQNKPQSGANGRARSPRTALGSTMESGAEQNPSQELKL